MQKRAICYARVSTDKQADGGVSLEDQVERTQARVKADAFTLVDAVVDDGYSASSLDRPGIQQVLRLVRKRQIDVIVVTKLDRLTRSVRDFADLLELFEKQGISLVSLGEGVDTSSAIGRMVLNVMMSICQWFREEIAEKTATALAHKKRKGEKVGGRVPFGFDVVERGSRPNGTSIKVLVRNEAEQAVLDEMFRLRAQGLSFSQIAEALNRRKITTKEGSLWVRQYIHRVMAGVKRNAPEE